MTARGGCRGLAVACMVDARHVAVKTGGGYFASEGEAQELAARLGRVWHGTRAKFWVEPVRTARPGSQQIIGYGVRSNMVNGLPPVEGG